MACRPVEHVEEAVPVGPKHDLAWAALPLHVDQDRNLRRVVVKFIVRRKLIKPFQLACICIERDHGAAIEIVAAAVVAVPVRTGISDAPIGQVEIRIVGSGNPHGSSTVHPGVGRPGVVAGLAGPRNGVEAPHFFAGLHIVGRKKTADTVLTAVGTNEHLVAHYGRGHGLAVSLLGVGDLHLPQRLAGLGVQGHQLGVQGPQEDAAAGHGHAAVVGPAAVGRDRAHLVLVVPALLAGHRVYGIHVAERGGQVHDAVDYDRRRLHGLHHLGLEDEGRPELAHVGGVDLGGGVVPRLLVIPVGVEPVAGVAPRAVQHVLTDGRHVAPERGLFTLLAGGRVVRKRHPDPQRCQNDEPALTVGSDCLHVDLLFSLDVHQRPDSPSDEVVNLRHRSALEGQVERLDVAATRLAGFDPHCRMRVALE